MDREVYRSVPFRFAINESNADLCKLEKLTNLFPDMKQIIELGIEIHFFLKIDQNNFSIKNYLKLII